MELVTIGRYLTVEKMQAIYDAFNTFNNLFKSLQLPTVALADNTVDYNISPLEICEKFNAVEANIQSFRQIAKNKISGYTDAYYKAFTWNSAVRDIKSEVERWINWINAFYNILMNTSVEFTPMLAFNTGGEQIYYIERRYEVN